MMPNCAKGLREKKQNKIKDFVNVSGPLGVTHLTMFTNTDMGAYMKVSRLPQGPTLTFKIKSYSLMHDVKNSQKSPRTLQQDFLDPPVLIINGFSGTKDEKTGQL